MDKAGAETALISTGQAGGAFTGDRLAKRGIFQWRRWNRSSGWPESNEYGAKMVSDYPNRFGLFASLPMPDVDANEGACIRAGHAQDGWRLLPTGWGNKYIGDKSSSHCSPNSIAQTVVYTHPTDAACCINIIPGLVPNIASSTALTPRA
jgi:hypothetical protein